MTALSYGSRPAHAYVAEVVSKDRCGIGVLFVDDRGHVLGRIRRTLPDASRDQAVFHGILAALWAARRLGTRALAVHVEDPRIVAQINGEQEVAWDLLGPYLQVRALLHAYRNSRVEADLLGWGPAAIAVAEAALRSAGGAVDDLPLWARPLPRAELHGNMAARCCETRSVTRSGVRRCPRNRR